MNLSGRKAVVTGGGRGIGLAVVKALAEAGAKVTFTARTEERIEEVAAELGMANRISGVVCDATDRVRTAEILSGGIDILINNAGVVEPIGHLTDVSIDDWLHNIEVNLLSAVHAIQCVLPGMAGKGAGTIVNLSSGAAHNAMEGWSAYCAGKAALAMVTRSVHLEYGGRGVRIFGFAPGVVDTGMQAQIRASGINPVSKLRREDLSPATKPARAIAWLCTEESNSMAGQELDIRNDGFRRAAGLAH